LIQLVLQGRGMFGRELAAVLGLGPKGLVALVPAEIVCAATANPR
jgi:hypothetical protein